jgi:hypothetical protein
MPYNISINQFNSQGATMTTIAIYQGERVKVIRTKGSGESMTAFIQFQSTEAVQWVKASDVQAVAVGEGAR